jgi:hypothetical protein
MQKEKSGDLTFGKAAAAIYFLRLSIFKQMILSGNYWFCIPVLGSVLLYVLSYFLIFPFLNKVVATYIFISIHTLKAYPIESFCLWHFSFLILFAPSVYFQYLSTLRNSKLLSLVYHLFRCEKVITVTLFGDCILMFLGLELLLFPVLWKPFWQFCDFRFVCAFLFLLAVFLTWIICIYYFAANLRMLVLYHKQQNVFKTFLSTIYCVAILSVFIYCYRSQNDLTSIIIYFQFINDLLSHKIELLIEEIAAILLIYVNCSFLRENIKRYGEY